MEQVRSLIAAEVRGLFADKAGKVTRVVPSNDGLFGPKSVSWRVHGDVTAMMIGGVSALMLQMLHPAALSGIWDHSSFRRDMQGRLRRTASFIALTTYGSREAAEGAIERVRRIHGTVRGVTPDGTPYHANDPALLRFVHAAEATSFLNAYLRYRAPLRHAEQDRYFVEIGEVALALGAGEVPRTRREAERYLLSVRRDLKADARTREAARLLRSQPPPTPAMRPFQAITMNAAIELLPEWARAMHGWPMPAVGRPLVRAGALGLANVLRWAMAPTAAA